MKINLSEVIYDDREIDEVVDTLRSGRVTMGEKCRQFESAFAEYLGVRHALFVNSGSSANLLCWFALTNPLSPGVEAFRGKGEFEVIVPAVAWSTTIWPIVQAGGTLVLVDCDPGSLTLSPEALEKAVGPATVAVFPVHPLGTSATWRP